jgi:hypothetical protein
VCPWWSTIQGEHNTNELTLIECLDKLHIEGAQHQLLKPVIRPLTCVPMVVGWV